MPRRPCVPAFAGKDDKFFGRELPSDREPCGAGKTALGKRSNWNEDARIEDNAIVAMSDRSAFGILAVLTLGLSALVVLEIPREDGAAEALAVPPRTVRSDPPAPAPLLVDHTDQRVGAILARPFVSRSRRLAETASAAASGPAGLPRLSGILVSPHRKAAIFAGAAELKPIIAAEGGRVGDYVVEAIAPDRVTLRGPEGEKVLHPVYEADAAAASAPIAAPAPTKVSLAGVADVRRLHEAAPPF